MTPLCKLATIHGRRGWKLRPLTRLLLVSNFVRNSELVDDIFPDPAVQTGDPVPPRQRVLLAPMLPLKGYPTVVEIKWKS
mmetsp:Transcript_29160/g.46970  ORF Transcript_29160/g.46970 Transcript_29160/m.46970 type:complete len:80 (-) Transcript_29160:126-365(-)